MRHRLQHGAETFLSYLAVCLHISTDLSSRMLNVETKLAFSQGKTRHGTVDHSKWGCQAIAEQVCAWTTLSMPVAQRIAFRHAASSKSGLLAFSNVAINS